MRKNMDKTIKLAPTIILFVFLFFIVEEVRGLFEGAAMLTSIECTSPKDCPAEFEFTGSNPDTFISICLGGYCVKWLVSNQ
jgi:hypothetical protein